MLQVKNFMFDLHKKTGVLPVEMDKQINEWLKNAGLIEVLTTDSTPTEIGDGYYIWSIWYEDLNNEGEEFVASAQYTNN